MVQVVTPITLYSILELRLNGATLLKGYGNRFLQVNGMVEPLVQWMPGTLQECTEFCSAISEVQICHLSNGKETLCAVKEICNYWQMIFIRLRVICQQK